MKNILLPLLFLCILPYHSFAQTKIQDINYAHAIRVYYSLISPIQPKEHHGYSEIKTTQQWKKKTIKYINYYDTEGNLTLKKESIKNSDGFKTTSEFQYNSSNQLTKAKLYHKKNKYSQYDYSYNESGKITQLSITSSNKKNKRTNSFWSYNAEGCLTEFVQTKSNGKDTSRRTVYEYYDSCKIARTIVYNGKGKIKSEWNYLCDQNGARETKKNERLVCQWQEYSKDTLMEIYQTTDKKGNVQKSITKFSSADTLPLVKELYDHKNRIVIKWKYDKSYERTTSYAYFKKNGKAKWSSNSSYINDKLSSTIHKKFDKITGKRELQYNDQGLLIENKKTGSDGKIKWQFNYEYIK